MKTLVAIALFTFLAAGCVKLPKGTRVASLTFRGDPVDRAAEEALEQIEITASSARVHRVGKMPTDWFAGVEARQDGSVECTLNCLHQNFAEPNIHVFDKQVSFLIPETGACPEVKVILWITRGPLGEGRIIALSTNDFVLK